VAVMGLVERAPGAGDVYRARLDRVGALGRSLAALDAEALGGGYAADAGGVPGGDAVSSAEGDIRPRVSASGSPSWGEPPTSIPGASYRRRVPAPTDAARGTEVASRPTGSGD
jgi:hypothetical protein